MLGNFIKTALGFMLLWTSHTQAKNFPLAMAEDTKTAATLVVGRTETLTATGTIAASRLTGTGISIGSSNILSITGGGLTVSVIAGAPTLPIPSANTAIFTGPITALIEVAKEKLIENEKSTLNQEICNYLWDRHHRGRPLSELTCDEDGICTGRDLPKLIVDENGVRKCVWEPQKPILGTSTPALPAITVSTNPLSATATIGPTKNDLTPGQSSSSYFAPIEWIAATLIDRGDYFDRILHTDIHLKKSTCWRRRITFDILDTSMHQEKDIITESIDGYAYCDEELVSHERLSFVPQYANLTQSATVMLAPGQFAQLPEHVELTICCE
jgi:hypothetical protein